MASIAPPSAELAALTPLERESVRYTLREEADATEEGPLRDAFEALARLVESSGLVAGKCRICGCDEDHACSVEGTGHGMGRFSPCGWADETETLCDAPSCVATAAANAPTVVLMRMGDAAGSFDPPTSVLGDCWLGSRAESFAGDHVARNAVDEVLGPSGPGPFPPGSGLTRGGRSPLGGSMPVVHTEDPK